jgi:hypothetical protein
MRILLAAVIVAAVFLSGTGCAGSDGSSDDTDPPSTAGAAPTSSAADNSKQVCADVKKLNAESLQKFTTRYETGLNEALANAEDQAKVEALANQAIADLSAQIKDWIVKVGALSASATNPEVKRALEALAAELKKQESGEGSVNDLKTAISAAEAAMAKFC